MKVNSNVGDRGRDGVEKGSRETKLLSFYTVFLSGCAKASAVKQMTESDRVTCRFRAWPKATHQTVC